MKIIGPITLPMTANALHFSVARSTPSKPNVWPRGKLKQKFQIGNGIEWVDWGSVEAVGGIHINERTGEVFDHTTHTAHITIKRPGLLARAVIEADEPIPLPQFKVI